MKMRMRMWIRMRMRENIISSVICFRRCGRCKLNIDSEGRYKISGRVRTFEFRDAKVTFPMPTMSPSNSPSGSKILENHSTVLSPISIVRVNDTDNDALEEVVSSALGARVCGGSRDFLFVAEGSVRLFDAAESVLPRFCFSSTFASISTDSEVVVLLKSTFPFLCGEISPESVDAVISDEDSGLPVVLFLLSLRPFEESLSDIFCVNDVKLRR